MLRTAGFFRLVLSAGFLRGRFLARPGLFWMNGRFYSLKFDFGSLSGYLLKRVACLYWFMA